MDRRDYTIEAAISQQIAVEQNLRATRMNWNLTFQGFMMAAFALVAAENVNPARFVLELTICCAGILVGFGSWMGILAAQKQSSSLKSHWTEVVDADSHYPRPFSVGRGALMGRLPTHMICMTIIVMWGAVMWILIYVPQDVAGCNARFGRYGELLCRYEAEARQT